MLASSKLTVRLTEAELRILRSQAIRNGQSLSAFARNQILHKGHGSTDIEDVVGQILPVVEARIDSLSEEVQVIKSEARQAEERATEKLKKAVQIIVEEVRKR